jgi:hypothetical protein
MNLKIEIFATNLANLYDKIIVKIEITGLGYI